MNSLSWCRVLVLVFIAVCANAAAATGQTVTVIGMPANSSLTVFYNSSSVGTEKADAKGIATVKFMAVRANDTDVHLYRETCDGMIRVLLQAPGTTLPESGCARQDAGWLFSLRPVTTFVVDVADNPSSVRITQGPAPAHWLVHGAPTEHIATREWEPPIQALVLSGGSGTIGLSSLSSPNCGDVSGCTSGGLRPAYSAGATYWLGRAIGIYGSVGRASEVKAHGTGASFTFDSATRLDRVNVAAIGGGIAGPTRIYGIGGVTYNRTRTTTSESFNGTAGGTQPTQQIEIETRGWGVLFGAGLEVWANRRIGMFGEFTDSTLRGKDVKDGEAHLDGTAMAIGFGVRFKLRP
jgi:hypothetical protein